jgi:hypothetical protein
MRVREPKPSSMDDGNKPKVVPVASGWIRVALAVLAAASWMTVSSVLILINK